MNRIEDRLRDAFGAAAETVRPECVDLLRESSKLARTRRLAPLAAAAAVAVVIIAAAVTTPLALAGGHGGPARPTGPAAPSRTERGSTPAAAVTTVPDVVGMQAEQANAVLSDAGLRLTVTARGRGVHVHCSFSGAGESCDRAVAGATVLAQTPAAGTRLQTGLSVVVLVAVTGSSPSLTAPASPSPPAATVTTVPDVLGMTQQQATAVLQSAGLVVLTVSQAGSGGTLGIVIAQNPVASTRLAFGATVMLTVAASAS